MQGKRTSLDSDQMNDSFPVIYSPDQGVIEIAGKDAADLLHRISTNDVLSSPPGSVLSTCFLNAKGRLIDVATLLIRRTDSILLLPSPGNQDTFRAWVEQFVIMEDLSIVDVSDRYSTFRVPVPLLGTIDRQNISVPARDRFTEHPGAIIIDRSIGNEQILTFLVPKGSHDEHVFLDAEPLKEGSPRSEFLRIRHGMPALQKEIAPEFNPYEAGLEHLLHGRKGCYVGQEVIARLATYDKVQRKLAGVLLSSTDPPARSEMLMEGKPAGVLTSISEFRVGEFHPGLAIVARDVKKGDRFLVHGADRSVPGYVVSPPFPIRAGDQTDLSAGPDNHEAAG